MDARLYKRLQENPIIAAIRDETGLERCLKAEPSVVFVLYGDICGIGGIVERIKKAGKLAIVHADLIAIFRTFVIDSMALEALLSVKTFQPDAIDILPGLMPTIIRKVRNLTGLPVLAGGLITEKREVLQALEAGALAISSTAGAVWDM